MFWTVATWAYGRQRRPLLRKNKRKRCHQIKLGLLAALPCYPSLLPIPNSNPSFYHIWSNFIDIAGCNHSTTSRSKLLSSRCSPRNRTFAGSAKVPPELNWKADVCNVATRQHSWDLLLGVIRIQTEQWLRSTPGGWWLVGGWKTTLYILGLVIIQ